MRTVLAVAFGLIAVAASADTWNVQPVSPLRPLEVYAYGGLADGPGYAAREPLAGVTANIGTTWLRVYGGASYGWLHKAGTSGGYQRGVSYGLEPTYRDAFLFAGMSGNFTDQTEYTKTVKYRCFGAGYRWSNRYDRGRAVSINEVRLSYYRESYSSYANRTELFAASYSWDRQLRGALYLRVGVRLGAMYFDDNPYPGAQRRNGLASTFNIGLVGRP